jgi:hypothetical protein
LRCGVWQVVTPAQQQVLLICGGGGEARWASVRVTQWEGRYERQTEPLLISKLSVEKGIWCELRCEMISPSRIPNANLKPPDH